MLATTLARSLDLADLESPYTHGHSSGVATLARDAAERCRLGAATVAEVEVAGLLHDVGRVAISDAVWERSGALTLDDHEQIRLHPYHSERILTAAGHAVRPARRAPPAGLTDREVEVLGLVAAGCSNREIAARLTISRRTAEHHVQHIYAKIGASSPAAAALFAMEHDLLGDG